MGTNTIIAGCNLLKYYWIIVFLYWFMYR